MKVFMLKAATDIKNPQQLRRNIQETDHQDMRRRKTIVAVNVIGTVSAYRKIGDFVEDGI